MNATDIQKIVLEELQGRYRVLLQSYLYCWSADPDDEGHKTAFDHDCFTFSFVAEKDSFFAFRDGCERRGVAIKYTWNPTEQMDVAVYDCMARERTRPSKRSWFSV